MAEYIDFDKIKWHKAINLHGEAKKQIAVAYYKDVAELSTANVIPRENIKLLGEELRKAREGITDERVLTGFNMAIAICNKYFGESEDKE